MIGDEDEMWRNLTGSRDGTDWPQPPNTSCLGVQVDQASLVATGLRWGWRDDVPLLATLLNFYAFDPERKWLEGEVRFRNYKFCLYDG